MKLFFFMLLTLVYECGQCQISEDGAKLNEVKLAIDKYKEYELANDILNTCNDQTKSDPLYIYYKYRVFGDDNYQNKKLGAYLDSAIYFLGKYLDFFPSNLPLQQKIIDLKIAQKQAVKNFSGAIFQAHYYLGDKWYGYADWRREYANDIDSLRLVVIDNRIVQVKFSLVAFKESKEEVSNNAGKEKGKYILYEISADEHTDVVGKDKTPVPQVKIYFTLDVTSPIMYFSGLSQLSFTGKLQVDNIAADEAPFIQKKYLEKDARAKSFYANPRKHDLITEDRFHLKLSERSRSDLMQGIKSIEHVCVTLSVNPDKSKSVELVFKCTSNDKDDPADDEQPINVETTKNNEGILDANSFLNLKVITDRKVKVRFDSKNP